VKQRAKTAAKSLLSPLLFRHPPIGLQPERLYLWSRSLLETAEIDGAVVEIGCALGGTAAWSSRMLSQVGQPKLYVCVDTFNGFVQEQFDTDAERGTNAADRHLFSANSMKLTRRVLRQHGAVNVELVQADVTTLDVDRLPNRIAACLVDVDLAEPVDIALEKVFPRMAAGGVILVDDCPEGYNWKARIGYDAFVRRHGLAYEVVCGMGVVRRPAG
jgi:O-methyltransferase